MCSLNCVGVSGQDADQMQNPHSTEESSPKRKYVTSHLQTLLQQHLQRNSSLRMQQQQQVVKLLLVNRLRFFVYKKIAVASVTVWRSLFALASCLLHLLAFCTSRSQKFSKKKFVSIALKCSETHRNAKKIVYSFDWLRGRVCSVGLWIWGSRVQFPTSVLRVLSLGQIINLHFLTLPRCKWVPVLLGKFPATDWQPVLGLVRATCQPNVTEIGNWLRPYGPYGSKRQTFSPFPPWSDVKDTHSLLAASFPLRDDTRSLTLTNFSVITDFSIVFTFNITNKQLNSDSYKQIPSMQIAWVVSN